MVNFPSYWLTYSYLMKLISRYRSAKTWYYAFFSPTETHTFQTSFTKSFICTKLNFSLFVYEI